MASRVRILIPGIPFLLALAGTPASAQFTEAAQGSGLRILGPTWGAAMGDPDGDGDLEILAGRHFLTPVMFWNQGGGTFDTSFPPSPFTGPLDRHGMLLFPVDDDEAPDVLILHGAGGGVTSEANELYLNDGTGILSPWTGAGGLDDPDARARCVSAADYDGDGRADFWIGNAPRVSDPNALFRNDGPLAFSDVAAAAGLDEGLGTVGGLWGDIDDDGDPDLLVGGEEFTRPTVLWRNDGGIFADVSAVFSPALPVISGADFGDYDNDGDLDLAVCDGGIGLFDTFAEGDTVAFYFNTRYGENGVDGLTIPSTEDTLHARVRYSTTYSPTYIFLGPSGVHPGGGFSFLLTDDYVGAPSFTPGVDLGTFIWRTAPGGDWEVRCSTPNTNSDVFDGFLTGDAPITGVTATDLEDGDFVPGGPRVWRNDGGAFAEVTALLGLPPDMLNPRDVSWVDFDNDGDLDLHVVDMGTSAQPNAPDALFANYGFLFVDVTGTEGLAGGTEGMGDGGVWGDVDDDGDLDLFLQEGAGPAAFSDLAPTAYHRNDGQRGPSIRLDLTGTASGPAAVGARVTVSAGALQVRRRVAANSWRGFQDPLRIHAGLGTAGRADSVVIAWPSGAAQTFRNPFPGRYAVREDDVPVPVDLAVTSAVDDPSPVPGDTVTVTVTAGNLAGPSASGVGITAALPPELAFVSSSASAGSYDPASGVWNLGTLAAAESLVVEAEIVAGTGGLSPRLTAALSALALDRPDTLTANDADSVTIAVQGVLAVSSSADQLLPVGASPLAAEAITVTDLSFAPAITAANDIRIRIPAGFPMKWDSGVGVVALTGTAAAKVSPSVLYEDSGRILVLDVLTDFAGNDRVTVSGPAFVERTAAAAGGRLELEIDAAGTVAALDDKTIEILGSTAAGEAPAVPAALRLVPPSPNPFRGRTTIRYEILSAASVRIAVHDVTGRRVRMLQDGPRAPGAHAVLWDGRDGAGRRAAAGVYFVRLEALGSERTRSIVLLR